MIFNSWEIHIKRILEIIQKNKINNKKEIIGVLGPQGIGKSTVSKYISEEINKITNLKSDTISLDDFYLTFEEREKKGIVFRGPPGTHDLVKLSNFINSFKNEKKFQLPIFNKGLQKEQGDFIGYRTNENIDIIIWEGWFNGLLPIKNGSIYDKLLEKYVKYWDFSFLLILKPINFEYSYKWRLEAEDHNIDGKMGTKEIQDFVGFFMDCLNPTLYYDYVWEYRKIHKLKTIKLIIDEHHQIVDSHYINF